MASLVQLYAKKRIITVPFPSPPQKKPIMGGWGSQGFFRMMGRQVTENAIRSGSTLFVTCLNKMSSNTHQMVYLTCILWHSFEENRSLFGRIKVWKIRWWILPWHYIPWWCEYETQDQKVLSSKDCKDQTERTHLDNCSFPVSTLFFASPSPAKKCF